MIRSGIRVDKFGGSTTRLDLVGRRHRGIVEKQDQVTLLGVVGLYGDVGADREGRDLLLFIVFVNLEVFLGQVVNVAAFFVGHHSVDQDEFRFSPDDRLLRCRRGGRGRHGCRW